MKDAGFSIEHTLRNTGEKAIETDQFNHNFFMIDGKKSGIGFNINFPYPITTDADLKGYMEIKDKDLYYIKDIPKRDNVFMVLEGYSQEIADHKVTVVNRESGAGVTFTVDKPLYRMVFWSCHTTLSPENFIWISVEPGEEESWISEYNLFVE